jgi:apolipoprotein N-acyltransferase
LIFTTPFFQHWVKPTLFALLGLGVLYAFGAWRLYDGQTASVWGVKLRLVQPDVPCTLKWDPDQARNNINKLIRLSRENNEQVTHIIWPESAVTFLLNYHHDERLQLMSAMRQGSVLITGAMRSVDEQKRTAANSLFVLDDLTDIHAFYDKSHLVPFGEYMPLRGILPLDKFVPFDSDIVAGSGPKTLPILNAPAAAPLVCYEAIFSGEVVDKNNRPAWLINVTNDGWYGFSAGPHHHFAMAQTRAVEEGLPLARAANTGISAVIDPYGRIVKKLDFGEEGVVDADLPQALSPTPFARYKHWPLWLLSCFFILISFFKQKSA